MVNTILSFVKKNLKEFSYGEGACVVVSLVYVFFPGLFVTNLIGILAIIGAFVVGGLMIASKILIKD